MSVRKKIVYISHGISVGGAEVAMLSALPVLYDHYRLCVFVIGRSDPKLLAKVDPRIRQVMRFWDKPSYLLPFYLPFIYLSLVKFRPDIMLSSLWRSAIPASLYRLLNARVKYFAMAHNTVFFHVADRLFSIWGMKQADVVLADSTATKLFVERFVGQGKCVRKLSYLTVPTPQTFEMRPFDAGLSFFFMGSLNVVKRVPLTLKTIGWLREEGLPASLHIYGRPGNDESNIRRLIAELNLEGFVFICGEIAPNEKHDIYRQHNCYIQLSAYEGMAMSVAEAMQQGMLCVVTSVGEIPHYATDGMSAVFMHVVNDEVEERSLRNLSLVLKDEKKCSALSASAHRTFKNAPSFAESLVYAIQSS